MAGLLICISDMVNYLGVIMHINGLFGTSSLAFLEDYDVYLVKQAMCQIFGDCVAEKEFQQSFACLYAHFILSSFLFVLAYIQFSSL